MNAASLCWFIGRKEAPLFVLLGRAGDSILMLPAFRAIHERTGFKPRVIVSTEYSSLYDGVSYVDPIPVALQWWEGVPKARLMAEELAGGAIFPQWWLGDCPIPKEYRGTFNLTCHGKAWGVNLALWPGFMQSMWERAGFTQDEMRTLPLVFDRRNAVREAALLKQVLGTDPRPVLLHHFAGISSPFQFAPEVLNPLTQRFGKHFKLVDLAKVHATRIFDLLALFERAKGALLCDSAPLHLSAATPTPRVCFIANGWTGSVPKGNVALALRYAETPAKLSAIMDTVASWQ